MPTRAADRIEDRQTRRLRVEQMLRRLPAQHREIITATYFRGRTTGEAARLLGLTPDTAKSRLYHAMRDLSDMMAAAPATRGPRHGTEGKRVSAHRRG